MNMLTVITTCGACAVLVAWLNARGTTWFYDYELSAEGMELLLFGRWCMYRVAAQQIMSMRLLEAPLGNWSTNVKRVSYLNRPFAREGVLIVKQDGGEMLITPDAPREFLRRALECGMSVAA